MLPVYMPMHFIHLHAHSFASPNGFYSVYRCICFPSVHSLQAPTVFILFTTRCILYAQFVGLPGFYSVYRRICFPSGTSCHSFTFRKSSRELVLVRLCMNVKQVEDSENRYGVYLVFCQPSSSSFHNIPDDSSHNPYIAFPKKRHSALFFAVAKFAKFNYLI